MIRLLERQDATVETISNYIKKDIRTTHQLITLLRRKGYDISLLGYGGMYHLNKTKCPKCHKIINTSNGLRIHHRLKHGVRIWDVKSAQPRLQHRLLRAKEPWPVMRAGLESQGTLTEEGWQGMENSQRICRVLNVMSDYFMMRKNVIDVMFLCGHHKS